jgi:hypothetical protein
VKYWIYPLNKIDIFIVCYFHSGDMKLIVTSCLSLWCYATRKCSKAVHIWNKHVLIVQKCNKQKIQCFVDEYELYFTCEMTKITNSIQSHKSKMKYKSENGRTRTSAYIRDEIKSHGGVSIPCRSITPAVSPFPRLGKRYDPCGNIKNPFSLVNYISYSWKSIGYTL